jgi:hypothetical protein
MASRGKFVSRVAFRLLHRTPRCSTIRAAAYLLAASEVLAQQ